MGLKLGLAISFSWLATLDGFEPLVGEEDVDLHRSLLHGYPVGLTEHRLVGGTLHRVVVLAHRELPDHPWPTG